VFIFILFESIYFCLFFSFYLAGGEQEITNKDIYLTLTRMADTMEKLLITVARGGPTGSGLNNLFTNTSISTDNFNYNLQLPLICVDDIILLDERLKEDSSARSELVSLLFTLIYFVS